MTTRPGLSVKISDERHGLTDVTFYCSPKRTLAIVGDDTSDTRCILDHIAGFSNGPADLIAYNYKSWVDYQRDLCLPADQRPVAWIGQEHGLIEHLTVQQHIEWINYSRGEQALSDSEQQALVATLELLGFLEFRPALLSEEQTLRVELLLALLRKPDVLLLHKPLNRLQPTAKKNCLRLLAKLKSNIPGAVVLVTDDLHEATQLADELLLVIDGRSAQQGPVHEVLSHPQDLTVAARLGYKAVFPATVSRHMPTTSTTILVWGTHVIDAPLIEHAKLGQTIHWMIPSRAISVQTPGHKPTHPDNCAPGVVQEIAWVGDTVELLISIPQTNLESDDNQSTLLLDMAAHAAWRMQLAAGSPLRLHFPKMRIHCIAPPPDPTPVEPSIEVDESVRDAEPEEAPAGN